MEQDISCQDKTGSQKMAKFDLSILNASYMND